ncbi:hypothetical protein SNEBB_009770 [Seison nebaliae]|nr:hypothetical protein SNEBB_009770 [Seison nebaliae]
MNNKQILSSILQQLQNKCQINYCCENEMESKFIHAIVRRTLSSLRKEIKSFLKETNIGSNSDYINFVPSDEDIASHDSSNPISNNAFSDDNNDSNLFFNTIDDSVCDPLNVVEDFDEFVECVVNECEEHFLKDDCISIFDDKFHESISALNSDNCMNKDNHLSYFSGDDINVRDYEEIYKRTNLSKDYVEKVMEWKKENPGKGWRSARRRFKKLKNNSVYYNIINNRTHIKSENEFSKLGKIVESRIVEMRENLQSVYDETIRRIALEEASKLSIANFSASSSWLYRFKKTHRFQEMPSKSSSSKTSTNNSSRVPRLTDNDISIISSRKLPVIGSKSPKVKKRRSKSSKQRGSNVKIVDEFAEDIIDEETFKNKNKNFYDPIHKVSSKNNEIYVEQKNKKRFRKMDGREYERQLKEERQLRIEKQRQYEGETKVDYEKEEKESRILAKLFLFLQKIFDFSLIQCGGMLVVLAIILHESTDNVDRYLKLFERWIFPFYCVIHLLLILSIVGVLDRTDILGIRESSESLQNTLKSIIWVLPLLLIGILMHQSAISKVLIIEMNKKTNVTLETKGLISDKDWGILMIAEASLVTFVGITMKFSKNKRLLYNKVRNFIKR